ncbi:MAG: amino acid ABC transporter substrate-binding protein [Deltaproteobacteria bacterium]|nr:amino acid ABC transporter substrate-binding protein [Deltaproteobacteria bacterium]
MNEMKMKSFFLFFFLIQRLCFCVEIGTVEEAPGNFTDENGQVVGLSVDFVKEIQGRIGDGSPIIMYPTSRTIKYSIEKPNFVSFSLSRTETREDNYYWISLVMRKSLVLYAKRDSKYSIKDLEEAKAVDSVGVVRNSIQHDFLIENNFNNIIPSLDHETGFKRLLSGSLSLMYHSPHGMAKLCRDFNIDINELEPVLIIRISNSYIAMSKISDPAIVRAWQDAAKEIKADGTFNRLAQKWLIYTEEYIGIPSEIKDGALNFWRE